MTVGKVLAEARQAAGLTMPDLAFLIGTVKQTIWQVETGRKPFPLGWLSRVPDEMREPLKAALLQEAREKIERVMGE